MLKTHKLTHINSRLSLVSIIALWKLECNLYWYISWSWYILSRLIKIETIIPPWHLWTTYKSGMQAEFIKLWAFILITLGLYYYIFFIHIEMRNVAAISKRMKIRRNSSEGQTWHDMMQIT